MVTYTNMFGSKVRGTKAGRKRQRRTIRKLNRKRGAAGAVVNNRRKQMILFKDPHYMPLPLEYFTKIRSKSQGFILHGTGAPGTTFNSFYGTHSWFNAELALNNLYAPLAPFNTRAIQQIDGISWTDPANLPIGFQTLCNSTTYLEYQVLDVTVKFTAYSSFSTDRILACICPFAQGTGGAVATNFTSASCQPYAVTKDYVLGAYAKPLVLKIDMAKYFGVSKQVYNNNSDGNYSGKYNTAPVEQVGLGIYMVTDYQGAPTNNIAFSLEFDYNVRLFNIATNLIL